jgi:UDPglucose 6-dehydrogenase
MGKSIAILGTGYVGMVASACLSEIGHQITAIDIDEDRIERIQSGDLPLYEPGLEDLVTQNREAGRLEFSSDWEATLPEHDIVIIAVGTPKREDGSCDISYVMNAAEMIGKNINDNTLIVTKSTVPVGTGELIAKRVQSQLDERFDEGEFPSFRVASNPEFLREGSAVDDFMEPDRIVVGAKEQSDRDLLASVYDPLDAPVVKTELRTAEMIKYASNAMLATKISFINEIANVCEEVGADVEKVADGMGLDSRIKRDFLNAGVGYGGSCFPKDTEALVQIAGQGGYDSQILSAVMAVNQRQRGRFADKIVRTLRREAPDADTIGVLGLSFKPETDDMREAPSVDIIQELQAEGYSVKAYDPVAMDNAQSRLSGVEFGEGPYDVAKGSSALALITEWTEFLDLDFERLKDLLKQPIVFDGRNVLPMNELVDIGYDYYGVGHGVDRLDNILSKQALLASSGNEGDI